jgi:PLP dependent protein
MALNTEKYQEIKSELKNKATLVAVSKMRTVEEILELYELGHRDFGENYVQELVTKHFVLPHDIHWHFIGHLQSNKVKYIVPFVHLIHGVDSFKLLMEIDRQGRKHKRVVDCLLQMHIAQEETKFGLSEQELDELIEKLPGSLALHELDHVRIRGLMAMASLTDDANKITSEFEYLSSVVDKYSQIDLPNFKMEILSMGMSADYQLAIEHGSNMVRIGSLLFGPRDLI